MKYIFCFLALTNLGCSYFTFSTANDGAKTTNTQLASLYIERSLSSDINWLKNEIFLSQFLENQELSTQDYEIRLSKLKTHWPLDKHPLASLNFETVKIDGDKAKVFFRRPPINNQNFPTISISLLWTGSRWSIVDDNFLGKGELFDQSK